MTRTICTCLASLWLAASAGSAFGAAVEITAGSVTDLAWLAGCWASDNAEPGSGEQWMAPAGGTMFGTSRTIRGGKTVTHEFMQIRETAPGPLAFIASPAGQATASFGLTRSGPGEVVFENLGHDFPQRIIYRVENRTVLHARIEGLRQGQLRRIDFPMHRVPCDVAETGRP